uniref:Uncharacterized protein n=1 Tax=Anopheles darlingi TaxID=43151 RepID=A0A2M4DSD4_ANODA
MTPSRGASAIALADVCTPLSLTHSLPPFIYALPGTAEENRHLSWQSGVRMVRLMDHIKALCGRTSKTSALRLGNMKRLTWNLDLDLGASFDVFFLIQVNF